MKILELNAFHYNRGGSETVMFNTSELLRSHGHTVMEFSLKWPENLPSPYEGYFAESKESRRGPLRPLANIVSYFYHFEAARNLERLIEAERPDIAQIHLIWGQLSPSVLSVLRRHRIPAVLTVHDYRIVCPAFLFRNGRGEVCEQCEGHRFYKCVANTCCKGSKGLSAMMAAEQYFRNAFFNPARMLDGMIYVSDFSRDIHLRYMPGLAKLPSVRLYNVSRHIDDCPGETAPRPDAGGYFLYMGRLSAEKGLPTLIEAFAGMPGVALKVVGTGPIEAELRRNVEARGARNITFEGYRKGAELESLLRGARYVVVPSECYENNPLTVIEAYSAAVPVLGADIGGVPEIVADGLTGFRFASGDAGSLREAAGRAMALSDDEYAAMRVSALDFARRNFSSEQYYDRLSAFFAGLVGSGEK